MICLLVAQKMNEAEGEEPAVDLLDPRVVIQEAEGCPDLPPVDLHEYRQLGHDQEFQGLGDVLHFGVGHGNEAPGVGQRTVVDREKRPDIFDESRLVQRPDCDVEMLDDLFRDRPQFLADLGQHRDVSPEGVHVLRLAETVVLDQPFIVLRIVRHHERRRRIEAVDQEAHHRVQRGIGRPAELEDPLVGKPIAGGVEQAVGDFLVVDRLEKAEEPPPFVVAIDVPLVQNRADAADDLTPTIGQKCLDLVPIVERIVGIADIFLLIKAEGGNPIADLCDILSMGGRETACVAGNS